MSRADGSPDDEADQDPALGSVGLVLGAGGGTGWAWMVGCLGALADVAGWDARSSDLIVGTSAGAGIGASLRAGLGPSDQLRQYRGQPLSPEGEALFARAHEAGAHPPTRRPTPGGSGPDGRADGSSRPGSMLLAVRSLGHWPPRAGLAYAGIQPRGCHDHDGLGARLDALSDGDWPSRSLWITAVRIEGGRRVVFGRDGVDPGPVGTAVEASSAVPGWNAPVRIADHDYVDGAAWSTTNADLVAGLGFDLAVVLAPLSVTSTRLRWDTRSLSRAYHRSTLSREVDVVHRNGTDVVVLEPTPDDVALLSVPRGRLDESRRRAIAERGHDMTVERLARDASLAPLSLTSAARNSATS